jgi:hypothetical protein
MQALKLSGPMALAVTLLAVSAGLLGLAGRADAAGPLFSAGPATALEPSAYPRAIVSDDFTGDGYFDLASTDYTDGTVSILLGSDSGSFTAAPGSPILLSPGVGPIATAEFGDDTHPDLAVGNQEDDTVTILQGLGNGEFVPTGTPLSLECAPTGIATGDFNGDTAQDIAISESCGEVQVFLGKVSGGFGNPTPYTLPKVGACGAGPGPIVAEHFVTANQSLYQLAVLDDGNDKIDLLLGKANGTFTLAAGSPFSTGFTAGCGNGLSTDDAESLAAGDFNGDGNQDVAVGFDTGQASVLLGNGAGKFTVGPGSPAQIAPANTQIIDLVDGDFNSDKYDDLAAADYWQGGGVDTAYFGDWVSVELGSSTGALSPAAGSPYQLQGIAGPLVAGAFADGLGPAKAGDDIVATDGEGASCQYYGVVTLVNEGANGGAAPAGNVYPGDGCKIPPPAVVTGAAGPVSLNAATLNGTVDPQRRPITDCHFEYGTNQHALNASVPCTLPQEPQGGPQSVSAQLPKLAGQTTYYFQLVASTVAGTSTGKTASFETCAATSIPEDALGTDSKHLDVQGCFTLGPKHGDDQTYVSNGQTVKVNGLYFDPDGDGQITIDPGAPALRAMGTGTVKIGGVVPVWKWISVKGGLDVPLSGTINLINNNDAKLFGLPFSGSLQASFTENEADITGTVNLSLADHDFSATLGVITDNATGIAGANFAVKGADEAPGHEELDPCNIDKPAPTGFYCASVTRTTRSGTEYSYAALVSKDPAIVQLGPLGIEDLEGSYDGAQHEWTAQGAVAIGDVLPGGEEGTAAKLLPTLSLGATFNTSPFAIDSASAGDSDLNFELGPATITEITLHLKLHPTFGIGGSAGLKTEGGWGIDGGFDFEQGEHSGWELTVHGTATIDIEENTLSIGGFLALDFRDGDHKVAVGGSWSRTFGPVSVSLGLSGGIDWPHWELDGNGNAGIFGVNASVQGILSDAGVGACGEAHVLFFSGEIGFKHFWSGETDYDGCDFSGLSTVGATAPSDAREAAVGRTIRLPRGLSRYEFAAVGASAPPAVTLSGPHGESLSTPVKLDRITATREGMALGVSSSKTTYFVITRPAAGRWRLAPEPGAAAPIRYEVASPLAPLHLKVNVTGNRHWRHLRWRWHAQRGISVRFIQTGATEETIATTGRGSGKARFAVAAGPGGTRHVVALVSIDGIPRSMVKVASFRAPAPSLPRVTRAGYRLRSGKLTVSWSRVRHASWYDVGLRLSTQSPIYRIAGSAAAASFEIGRLTKVREVTVTATVGTLTGNPARARGPARKHRRSKRRR